jgi:uncharacterized membrane protein YczE
MKRKIIDLIDRYLILIFALFIIASGIAFSIRALLGTTSGSCLPDAIHNVTGKITVGMASIILNTIFLIIQILIMRKKFKLIYLLELAFAIGFGFITDLMLYLTRYIDAPNYFIKWLYCIIGIILVAIGVWLEVQAKTIKLCQDALTDTLAAVLPFKFGITKVIMDITLLLIAAILLLIKGGWDNLFSVIREGTLASAIFVGIVIKYLDKFYLKFNLNKQILKRRELFQNRINHQDDIENNEDNNN